MIKPLLIQFHEKSSKPDDEGLKHVLFQLFNQDGKMLGFDWGYANFKDGEFENIETDGVTAMVVRWANQPNPQLIL